MRSLVLAVFLMVITASTSPASEVSVEKAHFNLQREGIWKVSVTLRHADEGWKHYADEWRVVNAGNKKVLGSRILMHPHVNEQPFTRSLANVPIPANVRHVYIEAHDKSGGWSHDKLKVDMSVKKGERYEINR